MSNLKEIDHPMEMICYFDVPFNSLVKNPEALIKYEVELLRWVSQVCEDDRNGVYRKITPQMALSFCREKQDDIKQAKIDEGVL